MGKDNRTHTAATIKVPGAATIPSEKDNNPSTREERNAPRRERKHPLEYAIFFFVIVTAIATGCAAYYTKGERDTMIDQEQRQLRAYVGVVPGDIENFSSPNPHLHFLRKNYRATPAYNVGWSTVGFAIQDVNAPLQNLPRGCQLNRGRNDLITMFPGVELPFSVNLEGKFNGADVLQVLAGKKQLIYYGTVCYRDAFGDTHATYYCWMYKGTSMTSKDADACLSYNDSD